VAAHQVFRAAPVTGKVDARLHAAVPRTIQENRRRPNWRDFESGPGLGTRRALTDSSPLGWSCFAMSESVLPSKRCPRILAGRIRRDFTRLMTIAIFAGPSPCCCWKRFRRRVAFTSKGARVKFTGSPSIERIAPLVCFTRQQFKCSTAGGLVTRTEFGRAKSGKARACLQLRRMAAQAR
jgi:hypothetical protein